MVVIFIFLAIVVVLAVIAIIKKPSSIYIHMRRGEAKEADHDEKADDLRQGP